MEDIYINSLCGPEFSAFPSALTVKSIKIHSPLAFSKTFCYIYFDNFYFYYITKEVITIKHSELFTSPNLSNEKNPINIDNFIKELNKHLQLLTSLDKLEKLPKETLFTIDRFEGDFAVCENQTTGKMFNIPKIKISKNAKEGDIIKFDNGIYTPEQQLTELQKENINNIFKKLQN